MSNLPHLKKQMREEFEVKMGHLFSYWEGPGNTDREELKAFLDSYADKIAQETYEAVLPEEIVSRIKHDPNADGWNECREQTSSAFITFIKGSI